MHWQDELEQLARERGPALVGYAYLLTGDLDRAEDLVQDGLVRAFARRRSTDVEWVEAYVRRTILNTYLDTYRRGKRWNDVVHLVAPPTTGPDEHSRTDARTDVTAALTHLSPRERACIVLRYYDDLTLDQIADRLGISAGAVKRYLSDAGKRLAPILDGALHTEDITPLTKEARR